jgi:hypothetical protein
VKRNENVCFFSDCQRSPARVMKAIICFLPLLAVASTMLHTESKLLIDIGDNHGKIREIFRPTNTISVLLRNFEMPENVIVSLDSIFGSGNKSFVVFNFASKHDHNEWIEMCRDYMSDPSMRVLYYERVFQQTHGKSEFPQTFHHFEDFMPEVDPQAPIVINDDTLHEQFAEGLDRWFKYISSGYILFSTLDEVELYIGCLYSRAGTFLFIIEECEEKNFTKNFQHLESIFAKAWKLTHNLKFHILINQTVFCFYPFEKSGTSYGVVDVFERLQSDEDLKQINGHPLNVEMFYSVFSVNKPDDSYELENFSGPDADVGRLLGEQMNATG